MHCRKYNIGVLVWDCEYCLSRRLCEPVCFRRKFIWGVPDDLEPQWVYSYKIADKITENVSYFFDPKWEGNFHLLELTPIGYKKTPIPPEIRWEVWERDDFNCQTCGKRKFLAIDHIYPESKGGTLEISNLQTLCKNCNSKKGVKAEVLSG